MIAIPRSQRLTMITNERMESAETCRASQLEFLQDEDYEKDPYVYNRLNTEIIAEA